MVSQTNKNNEIIQRAYDIAYNYEATRGSCPQCVLAALKETLDVGDEATIKAADALAGGTALSCEGTCGALVGGMLAIGSLVGREYESFRRGERKRRVFSFAHKLYTKFIEEYGSPLCCNVQKHLFGRSYCLLDAKQYAAFEKAGAHVDKCPSVSGNVAKWTATIIIEDLKHTSG